MTLRELIEDLEEIASTEDDKIEVVATAKDGTTYTPVISIMTEDGVRTLRVC